MHTHLATKQTPTCSTTAAATASSVNTWSHLEVQLKPSAALGIISPSPFVLIWIDITCVNGRYLFLRPLYCTWVGEGVTRPTVHVCGGGGGSDPTYCTQGNGGGLEVTLRHNQTSHFMLARSTLRQSFLSPAMPMLSPFMIRWGKSQR